MSAITFPEGFIWGTATAAYQIEGATRADGRGVSIWDTFSHTPGKVQDGHTGDVACDHYHRYAQDVALMADLGIRTYRFSVSWPRVQPDGHGAVNPAGLGFYDRLVDTLLDAGIDPMVTLYHWDLPQALEDQGGWPSRDTAYRFADYAQLVYERLGDRVTTWTTHNEPWCAAFLGYASGIHAPGRTEPGAAFAAVHHLLLGHGLAVQALREAGAQRLSIVLNPAAVAGTGPGSEAGVRLMDGLQNRIFLDPLLRGEYPEDVLEVIRRFSDLSYLQEGDLEIISRPLDLLGINYYSPSLVGPGTGPGSRSHPGTEGIELLPPQGPVTAMGWQIEPAALTALLKRIATDYPGVPLMITENGAAFNDVRTGDRVHDADRIAYLEGHIRAAHQAITEGVDLRGYLVWSLLDNFEWAEGYHKRFGLIRVEYDTQERILKDSALWYREVIKRNGLV